MQYQKNCFSWGFYYNEMCPKCGIVANSNNNKDKTKNGSNNNRFGTAIRSHF